VSTYDVATNGTYTTLASFEPDESADITFTPNGSSLLTAAYSDNAAVAINPNTGAQQIAYSGPGSATAVAVSPNGRYVATGSSSYTATVNLVDTTTDSVVWTRLLTEPPNGDTTYAEMFPDTMTFAANSAEVFGLASFLGETGIYLFASDIHPVASHLTVKISEVAPGHKLPVTITGPAGAHVTLTAQRSGAPARSLGSVTLPSSGHTSLSFASTFSGTLTAAIAGDAGHFPASTKVAYTVGSRSRAYVLGGHKRHHVTYYKKLGQVRILLSTTPAGTALFTATPQELIGGHWRSARTLQAHEISGKGGIYFRSMRDNVRTRVRFVVKSSTSSRGSHVTSGVFVLHG
jgi:hypothetical protein